jgi:cysteinyl-tRNA synthetase
LIAQRNSTIEIPQNIQKIAEQRMLAKQEKDYAMADVLRDQLI